ncbi:MAG: VTT domain-containing protein [Bryobacteraceae bacterium]
MHILLDFLRTLTNPERLILLLSTVMSGWLGYALLVAIVFAETGLLVGFFLPGDSLLFTVGVVAGAGQLNIVLINVLLMAAAVIGDAVGYTLGRRAGPRVFCRPDSRLFKQEHLLKTKAFYEKHGGKTIIYARFVPIIRTFAPFVAGVAQMPYHRFAMFNIVGGIGWVFAMTMLGYTLGNIEIVRKHFEKVILLVIFVSVLPIVLEFVKARRAPQKPAPECVPELE